MLGPPRIPTVILLRHNSGLTEMYTSLCKLGYTHSESLDR